MEGTPRVPEFFRDKRVFLTGGTGFIGKVFLEKLLRSCPDVDSVYMLMRPKKGKSVEERIKTITDLPLFDLLRNQRPEVFKKIKIISGDVAKLGLGLSDEDRQVLINEIDLIYHVAASVRFNDTLTESIIMNTRGTREVAILAAEMKHLKVFTYVSTAFCNCDHQVVEEKLYPAHTDWRQAIKLVETLDEKTMNIFTEKYMHPFPNSYTFSKHLSEHVVHDLLVGKVPVVIARPSIVISTWRDPVPGWIDNFNGPTGILIASGKGIVRTMYSDPNILADYIPVDIIAKGLILSVWHKYYEENNTAEISFYNGTNNNFQALTFKEMVEMGKRITAQYPLEGILWYPGGGPTNCWYNFFMRFLILQLLPAFCIDGLLKLTGHTPFLVRIQRKIYVANMAIQYFITHQWTFLNHNSLALQELILPEDEADFVIKKEEADPFEYFKMSTIGAKRYLLNEFDDEGAKRHFARMYILNLIAKFLWFVFLGWLLFYKIDITRIIARKYDDLCTYLTTP